MDPDDRQGTAPRPPRVRLRRRHANPSHVNPSPAGQPGGSPWSRPALRLGPTYERVDHEPSAPPPRPAATRRRLPRPPYRVGLTDLAAAALIVPLIVVVAARIARTGIYATADAGHYLADADAILGQGVRESRHLPGFPVLLALLRLFLSYETAIAVAAVVLVVLLYVGFYLAIRGRFDHSLGEPVGALVYAGCTTVAEALGWYGASMLLGLAVLPLALRAIDDALRRPSRLRLAIAAVLCAAAALTHPFPFAMLGFGGVVLAVASLVRARPSERRARVASIAVIGLATLVAMVPVRSFYTELQSPVEVRLSLGQLDLIWTWAYREDWPVWTTLVVLGLIGGLIGLRRLPVGDGWLVPLAFAAIAAIAVAGTVLFVGDPSYTTRYLYLLALPAGLGAAWSIAELERRHWFRDGGGAIALAVAVSLFALVSFDARLGVATRYYNRMTPEELAAIEHLAAEPDGTVLVTAKGADRNAGTLYGWLVEGIARHRAVGPGQPYLFLLQTAREDALDAERLLAGNEVIEGTGVRLGLERSTDVVTVSVERDGDWIPAWNLWFPYRGGDASGDRTLDARQGELVAGPDGLYRIRIERSGDAARLRIDWDSSRVGLHLIPSRVLPTTLPVGTRSQVFRQATEEGPVTTSIVADTDPLKLETAPDDTWTLAAATTAGRRSLTVDLADIDPGDDTFRIFTDRELLDRLDIAYVLTWRESQEDTRLGSRACVRRQFENEVVRVYAVDRRCGRRG